MSNQSEVVGVIRVDLQADKAIRDLKIATAEQKKYTEAVIDSRAPAAIATIGRQFAQTNRSAEDLLETLQAIGASESEIKDNVDQFHALTKAAKETAAAVEKVAVAEKKVEIAATATNKAQAVSSGGGGDGVSKLDRGFSTVERFAGSLGASGVNQVTGIAGDALGVGQALTGVGASLTTVLIAAAPVAAIIGGITLALKLFQEQADKATIAIKENYEEQRKQTELAIQNRDVARTKSSEQNKQDIDDLSKDIDDYGKMLKDLRDARADVDKAYADLGSSFNPIQRSNLGAQGQELDKQIAATRAKLDELDTQFQNNTLALPPLIKAHEDETAALNAKRDAILATIAVEDKEAQRQIENATLIRSGSSEGVKATLAGIGDQVKAFSEELLNLQMGEQSEDTAKKIEWLKAQLADLSDRSRDLTFNILPVIKAREAETLAAQKQAQAIDAAAKAADLFAQDTLKLRDLDTARAKQLADQARDASRNRQVSALEDRINAAKAVEAEQERGKKVIALREKAGQDELDAAAKNADEIKKTNADFLAESMKAQLTFQTEQLRAEEDYGTQRKRQLRDLTASLSELAARGDVSGFISTQRSGVNSLQDNAEDQSTAARRRTEDFQRENDERTKQRDQRLQEIQQSFAAETAQRQQNLQQQLAQEAEAGKARILQSAVLEKQLSELREQFAAEDAARTLADQKANYEAQRQALLDHQKEQAEIIRKGTQPVIDAAGRLVKTVGDELNRAIANLKAGQQMARTGVSGGSKMHDVGALYTQPTTLLSSFAEKPGMGDAVIPFRQSEGLMPALDRIMQRYGGSQGSSAPVNVYVTTGSVASQQDLADVKSAVIAGVNMAKSRGK